MSLGTSIVLAAILPTAVFLFAVTKDRWNWRKIVMWGLLLPSLIAVFVIGCIHFYSRRNSKPAEPKLSASVQKFEPTKQFVFYELRLHAKSADVKFAKGEPVEKWGDERWIYSVGSGSSRSNSAQYLIGFKEDHVRFILYAANDFQFSSPEVYGCSIGTPYQEIQTKLGNPTHISTSDDGLQRMISYDGLNVVFIFAKAKLITYGIYEPTDGLMEFSVVSGSP